MLTKDPCCFHEAGVFLPKDNRPSEFCRNYFSNGKKYVAKIPKYVNVKKEIIEKQKVDIK